MKDQTGQTVSADEELQQRLLAVAEEAGETHESFIEELLAAYAGDIERTRSERTEDEQRWNRYCETGESISITEIRDTLKDRR